MDGAHIKRTSSRLGTAVPRRHSSSTVCCVALLALVMGLSLMAGRQEQTQMVATWLRSRQQCHSSVHGATSMSCDKMATKIDIGANAL